MDPVLAVKGRSRTGWFGLFLSGMEKTEIRADLPPEPDSVA